MTLSDAGPRPSASPVSSPVAAACVGSTWPTGCPSIICAIDADQRASSTCRSEASVPVNENVMKTQ